MSTSDLEAENYTSTKPKNHKTTKPKNHKTTKPENHKTTIITVSVVIGLVVILVIALYFGGVFDPPSKHPLDYTVDFKYKIELSYEDRDKSDCRSDNFQFVNFIGVVSPLRVIYKGDDSEVKFYHGDMKEDYWVDEWGVEKVSDKFVLYIRAQDDTDKYYLTQSDNYFKYSSDITDAYDFSPHITDDGGNLASTNTEDSLQMCTVTIDGVEDYMLCTGSDIPKSPDDDNCSPLTVNLEPTD
jgi:hypothetical protein